jgi:calnexin
MQNGILFDNIYIGHSVEDARKLADETFFEKHPIEELAELADKPKEPEKKPSSPSDLKFLDDPVLFIKEKWELFLTILQKDGIVQAAQFVPEVAGGLGAILVSILAIVVGALASGSPPPAAKKVATDLKEKAAEAKDKVAEAAASGAEAVKGEVNKRSTRSQS